jgi:hypothetical protein
MFWMASDCSLVAEPAHARRLEFVPCARIGLPVTEAPPSGPELPGVVLAAAVLAAEQVSFVLVGSAALRLRGEQVTVGDVDVVIEPGEPNLRRLHDALAGLAVRPGEVPAVHRLRDLSVTTVVSSYGRVDCLLERGRRDWHLLRRGAEYVAVADAPVLVASADDAWALRRRFKKSG